MAEYITHSRAETVALGKRMAAVLQPCLLYTSPSPRDS